MHTWKCRVIHRSRQAKGMLGHDALNDLLSGVKPGVFCLFVMSLWAACLDGRLNVA